jgi:hypothetical protein
MKRKWNLGEDFTKLSNSYTGFYELDHESRIEIVHYKDLNKR